MEEKYFANDCLKYALLLRHKMADTLMTVNLLINRQLYKPLSLNS